MFLRLPFLFQYQLEFLCCINILLGTLYTDQQCTLNTTSDMNTESSFCCHWLATSYQQDECAVCWQRCLFQLVASTKGREKCKYDFWCNTQAKSIVFQTALEMPKYHAQITLSDPVSKHMSQLHLKCTRDSFSKTSVMHYVCCLYKHTELHN